MKKTILILTMIISALQCAVVYGQNTQTEIKKNQIVTDTIKVYGNCDICKKRIEGELIGAKGIHSANWNVEIKILAVSYDESQVSLDDIHQKVADVGHDTDKARAKDEVYNNLMGCCQYERPKHK